MPAILGRTWTTDDDRRGGGPDGAVAVISYAFWQRRFGGASDVIGRPLVIERVPFTIVGVTPPGFFGVDVGRTFDVAIPLGTEPLIRGKESALDRRSNWWLNVMGRLRADQSLEAAQTALRGVQPQVREATMPQDWREDDKQNYLKEPLDARPGGDRQLRTARSLSTAAHHADGRRRPRAAHRLRQHRQPAARARDGAAPRAERTPGARRLARPARATTSRARASCSRDSAPSLGLLFARWFSSLLVRQLSTATNNVHLEMALDWRILGFTAGVAIATAVIFGTVPALRATRVDPHDAMKTQGRGIAGQHRFALGNLLVVVQVALSMVLLVGAGLFMRTFTSLANLNLGFDRQPVLVAAVNIQPLQLEPDMRADLLVRLREAAAATPGVASAALSVVTPVSGSTWSYRLELLDGKPIEIADKGVYVNFVSPDWFKTYGTKMLAGRDFTAADKGGAPAVVIVNEAFARKFTGGVNPMGRRVREPARPSSPNPEREIVGYVADAVYRSLREPVPATMYLPFEQNPDAALVCVAQRARRRAVLPALLTKGLAAALTGVNGGVAITFRPIADQVDAALTQERLVAMLSGFFGVLALLLGRTRALRRDVVRRQPAAERDRSPHGARRGPVRCRRHGARPRRAPRRPGRRRRSGHERLGVDARRSPALRPPAARSADADRRRVRARSDRRARRLDSSAASRAHRSGTGAQGWIGCQRAEGPGPWPPCPLAPF